MSNGRYLKLWYRETRESLIDVVEKLKLWWFCGSSVTWLLGADIRDRRSPTADERGSGEPQLGVDRTRDPDIRKINSSGLLPPLTAGYTEGQRPWGSLDSRYPRSYSSFPCTAARKTKSIQRGTVNNVGDGNHRPLSPPPGAVAAHPHSVERDPH